MQEEAAFWAWQGVPKEDTDIKNMEVLTGHSFMPTGQNIPREGAKESQRVIFGQNPTN